MSTYSSFSSLLPFPLSYSFLFHLCFLFFFFFFFRFLSFLYCFFILFYFFFLPFISLFLLFPFFLYRQQPIVPTSARPMGKGGVTPPHPLYRRPWLYVTLSTYHKKSKVRQVCTLAHHLFPGAYVAVISKRTSPLRPVFKIKVPGNTPWIGTVLQNLKITYGMHFQHRVYYWPILTSLWNRSSKSLKNHHILVYFCRILFYHFVRICDYQ